jgi:hypothetical protein
MDRPYDDLAHVGLVDETVRLHCLRDTKLDSFVSDRRHKDPAAGSERSDQLDPLDVAVPLGPAGDIRP